MPIVQVTQPASFPVTLAEALTACRLYPGDADADVTALIGVATDFVENYILRAVMPRTFARYAGSFPASFRLTRGPATAISSLVYFDVAGVSQILAPANYTFDAACDPERVVPVPGFTWPVTAMGENKVILTYVAGYTVVPPSIRHAVLLLVSQWYDQRGAVSERALSGIPFGVAALLENYRSFAA